MNTSSTNSSSNQKVIAILKWIFSILIGLSALGALASKSFLSCLILLLVASLLFPPLTEFWRSKLPFLKNRVAKIATVIVLFVVGMAVSNDIDKTTSTNNKEENKTEQTTSKSETEAEETTEEIETIPTIKHEILHETVIRYDKAPSYFILIDEVDLSNEKFKDDIKNLINKIVTEKGAKISIDILDNKNTLELFYKSHYGANTLGRILNKSELAQLEKHSIASFSGELETDMYPNTLYFFPSASKSTAKVGKFVEIIEYNPVIKNDKIVKQQRADLENQKAQSDKKKKDFEKNCFSSWDGSHRELVKLVKANMNDKKSFEHEETTYSTLDDYAVVIMKFRGKNALGNVVLNSVKAKVSYSCEVLEIME